MTTYYQLGGFRPSISWFKYDDNKLADGIAGRYSPLRPADSKGTAVELALGLRPSGASCLLLTEEQVTTLHRVFKESLPSRSFPPTDFESISPIEFRDSDELRNKLRRLAPKKGGGKGYDTSQANRGFRNTSGPASQNRFSFEHNRLLYRLICGQVDHAKFYLNEGCRQRVKIAAFSYNTWSRDQGKPAGVRQMEPTLLDIGITMVSGSSSPSEYFATSNRTSHHFVIKKNKSLDPGRRKAFANGNSKETDNPGPQIKDILKEDSENPTVLLVTDAEASRRVLEYLGISTSEWNIGSGIKELVHDFRRTHMTMSPQGSSHRERSHNTPYRSRSRSPPRRSQVPYADLYPTSSAHSPSPGPPSRYSASSPSYAASSKTHTSSDFGYASSSRLPPARIDPPSNSRRSYQPVYIVDIKAMYLAIGGVQSIPLDLHAIAAYVLGKPVNREQTCAGDESSLIIDCWESFARGGAVDEQNEERKREVHSSSTVSTATPTAEDLVSGPGTSGMPAGSGVDDDDEDWDPNDALDQEAQQEDAPTEAKTVRGTYADLIFGDGDDYGSEDDY